MGFEKDSSDYGDQAILPLHNIITDPITPANQATVDATGALKVTGGGEEHTDGEIVQAGDKGSVAIGSDGTNFRFLKVDANGELQVDVVTLPSVTLASQVNPFTSPLPANLTQVGGTNIGVTNPVSSRLTDGTGYLSSVVDSYSNRNLQVSSIQNVYPSVYNNSTANLTAGASFTGTGETTLGIVGIQVNIATDQPCTIQVQQSMDNTNWDIVDTWELYQSVHDSRTFQATASYFRLIVTNNGTVTTSYLRLQVALCPVVETVPRALTRLGSLKVASRETHLFTDCFAGRLFSSHLEITIQQTEVPIALFINPVGNNKDVIISKIIVDVITKGNQVTTRFYAGPTVTANGTANTIVSRKYKGTSPSSTVNVYSSPTVSANGVKVVALSAGTDSNSLLDDVQNSLIIGADRKILMTGQASGNNTVLAVTLIWAEY